MFNIKLGNPAKRFLKNCEISLYERLMNRIRSLASDPFPSDAKRVVGRKEKIFRVRAGEYRVLYAVFYEQNLILITDVDKRSRAYN